MERTIEVENKSWIPKVTEERIQELAARIKPIVRFARGRKGLFVSPEGYPYHIEPVDVFDVAYTSAPKPTDEVTDLEMLCNIRTYHSFIYRGMFRPTIAEVLAQIPCEHLDNVVAFEIVGYPETSDDRLLQHEAIDAGYHVATTRLYIRK